MISEGVVGNQTRPKSHGKGGVFIQTKVVDDMLEVSHKSSIFRDKEGVSCEDTKTT